MMDKGEAYMPILKSIQIVPTTAERLLTVWSTVNETNVRSEMKISSKNKPRKTLSLFCGQNKSRKV
jgi:hypothetical protein